MRSYRGILGKIWIAGPLPLVILLESGTFQNLSRFWVLCKLPDVEEGCSEVEDDHGSPCRETGYQGHELFGLDGASIRGCKDLHGSTSTTRCFGVDLEGFGCQGRLDPGGRVQTPSAKGTVQRGKRQGRVSETIHDKKVGADRGSLRSRSGYHANNHLGHCAEGRREVDETVNDVARALNMLDVESQEGIIKAALKPVVHSFMETVTFTESQPCQEETDEPNDQSDEEEELCPHLEEAMAASWIAQIGEEDLSETEAVDSFIALGMGNWIPGNPSGTLDSGQCCRTSVDWRSCMCRVGAKVEHCWSSWGACSLQDDDSQRGRRYSTSHKIDDDTHYD